MQTELSSITDWPLELLRGDVRESLQSVSYIIADPDGVLLWFNAARDARIEGLAVVRRFHAAEFPVGTTMRLQIHIIKPPSI